MSDMVRQRISMTRVGCIVQRFADMELCEFVEPKAREGIKLITEEIFSKEGLSEEKAQTMTYLELVRLIDNVGGNPRYDDSTHDSWGEQMFEYACLARVLLDESWGNAGFAKIFIVFLTLEEFCEYIGSEHLKECCKGSEDYTISEFLREKIKESKEPWCPIEPLDRYVDRIKGVNRNIGELLVDSFRIIFPDKFDMSIADIRDKYHDSAMRTVDNEE